MEVTTVPASMSSTSTAPFRHPTASCAPRGCQLTHLPAQRDSKLRTTIHRREPRFTIKGRDSPSRAAIHHRGWGFSRAVSGKSDAGGVVSRQQEACAQRRQCRGGVSRGSTGGPHGAVW
eukprot:1245175-Pyramimonas_sp.AAC.1